MRSLHVLKIVFILIIMKLTKQQNTRKILNEETQAEPKKFMVYLVKAPQFETKYSGWICSGAIVHRMLVLTSAACMEEAHRVYAIAGYSKYVRYINADECTRRTKKRIVKFSRPQWHDFDYNYIEKWSYSDIAIAEVETPYVFDDIVYRKYCSYPPQLINVSYQYRFETPGRNAEVYGWGLEKDYGNTGASTDNSSVRLLHVPVKLTDNGDCLETYEAMENIRELIKNYMICTNDRSTFDSNGENLATIKSWRDNNTTRPFNPMEPSLNGDDYDKSRIVNAAKKKTGICQNDHGGPLVSNIGGREFVIGVASVYRLDPDSRDCVGPYLFTSTYCNSGFLNCIIKNYADLPLNNRRSPVCDIPPKDRGFSVITKVLSWDKSKFGSSKENQSAYRSLLMDSIKYGIEVREQIPLHDYWNVEMKKETSSSTDKITVATTDIENRRLVKDRT